MKHVRTVTDRSANHIHRWQVTCSCGWRTIPLRSKKTMEAEWTQHSDWKPIASTWREPTALEDLPEAFR